METTVENNLYSLYYTGRAECMVIGEDDCYGDGDVEDDDDDENSDSKDYHGGYSNHGKDDW